MSIANLTVGQQEQYIARMARYFRSLKPSVQREIKNCLLNNPKLQQRFPQLLGK